MNYQKLIINLILQALFPLVFIMLPGWLSGQLGYTKREDAHVLATVVIRFDIKTSALQSLVCSFPDMAYFGAPVLAVLIGPEGFLGGLIGNLVTSVLMIPLAIVLIRMGDKDSGNGAVELGLGRLISRT